MSFYIVVLALSLSSTAAPAGIPQDPPATQDDATQGKTETDEFFSGNVVELAADHVTVSRTILGKPPEKRTFKIIAATKVEGKLKQKSRVTVRYGTGDEGDVALSILVREHADKNDNTRKK